MADDMRTRLEDIALQLIREVGPRGFTMAELSRRAGVSVAAPYRHFADRQELVEAVAVRVMRMQRDRYLRAVAAESTDRAKLVAFTVEMVRLATEAHGVFDPVLLPGLVKEGTEAYGQLRLDVQRELTAAASAFTDDEAEQLDLLIRLGAVAHGFAQFMNAGLLGSGTQSRRRAEAEAARSANAVLDQALARSSELPSTE